MLKKILIGLLVILGILCIVISLRPSDFRLSRSVAISAPPATVFAQVNELRVWEAWSPWAKMDPATKYTYEGPPSGNGSISRWKSDKLGEGSMTIVESKPAELIGIKLEFIKPMSATNDVRFDFKPQGSETFVTWTMTGKNSFLAKAFGLFFNSEKMLGEQFDQGLAQLEAVSEASATAVK